MSRTLSFLVFAGAILTADLRAVIVDGGDGTQNTTVPGNGVPWDHVGKVNGASGVYLGSFGGGYWVATATHVGAGNLILGSTTYTLAAGSALQIGGSDLTLFRLTSDPGLDTLTLSSAEPALGSTVTMIGNGANRGGPELYWSVNQTTDPWTWTQLPSSTGANARGYAWASGRTLRWGTNILSGTTTFNIGTGDTSALTTTFDPITGEAQGAVGDSGGAVFYYNASTGTWELTGIMGAIATYSGQPGSTAVFGDMTFITDIAAYHDEIVTAIPEPAKVALLISASVAGTLFRRRRARAIPNRKV